MLTMVDDRRRGIGLGAADYFVKPIDKRVLVDTLGRLCRNATGTVLVVDDDDAARGVVRRALSSEGWTVHETADGRLAIDWLAEHVPDLVVLDLMMPRVDGFEVIGVMKRDARLRDVPIVVVTAMTLGPDDLERLRGQIETLLLKGALSSDALLPEIRSAVRRYGGGRTRSDPTVC